MALILTAETLALIESTVTNPLPYGDPRVDYLLTYNQRPIHLLTPEGPKKYIQAATEHRGTLPEHQVYFFYLFDWDPSQHEVDINDTNSIDLFDLDPPL